MQQNTLSTTLNFSSGDTSGGIIQDVEAAGRLVDKNLNYDSSFPSLLDMLRVNPQGGASVSGLSETDYPNSGDTRTPHHLHSVRKEPLPSDLMHHFQHMQCNCMMGLFPDISRAWLTIDSDIYVWLYEDGSDLAYFDGLHETILSVGLVKPRPGVFKPYIEHLLVLTTISEIVLLGVSFSQDGENDGGVGMHLLPEPLFSVPSDGAYVLTIRGTADGRIFMGSKDGCLYELVYQAEDGWFSRKCQKVNLTRSSLSYLLPSILTFTEDDPITQVEVDSSRHILYTLSDRGTISVYDLESDGKGTNKIVSVPHNTIMNTATQVAKTVEKANFKGIVSLCPIAASESTHVHLVVVTGTGVRLYYTTFTLTANVNQRPSQLTLLHVRLPPGFAANATTYKPTKVHKALYSSGTGILCANENNEADRIWSMSSDQYPYHPSLAESHAVRSVDGYVWALADVTPPLWCSALNPPTMQGTRPPLLVTQHQQSPRKLVLLSANGADIVTFLRPVDQLQHLLQECGGAEGASVKDFFAAMTPTQAAATALILACDPQQTPPVTEWATRALFLYGAIPASTNMPFTPQPLQQNYSFHPSQMSTPMPGGGNMNSSMGQPQITDASFSPLHNALYLYLARILRPIWTNVIAKETKQEEKVVLTSVMQTEEFGFLARQVEHLAKFLSTNQAGTAQPHLNTSAGPGYGSNNSVGAAAMERGSLLALRGLLDQISEVLNLLTILTTHNLALVTVALHKDHVEQLKTLTFRDIVLSGRDLARALIMALLDRYHGDNASSDAISERLRQLCPGLFRIEDAKLAKANEIILAAKNNSNKMEKEQGFKDAVSICKQIGHHVNVPAICSQLAGGGAYEGIVDLCLSVAAQRDPAGLALHYYRNGEPPEDHQGYIAFTTRVECYRVMLSQLNQLVGTAVVTPASPSIPSRPGPPSPPPPTLPNADATQFAEQIISLIVASDDELSHVTLYQWLVDTQRTDRLLAVNSLFLESFLTRSNGTHLSHHHLLWRFYERNKDYYKAAKTLSQLADQSVDSGLSVRVEYLSRALMCLSSCEMNTATSHSDFMLHLEEKKDVARVQLMVLDAVQSEGVGGEAALAELNSGLLDLTTLYEKFAEPAQLWECKLAIVHCAGHSEPQLVQSLWTNIIDAELARSVGRPTENRIDSLSSKLKSLARLYLNNPNYFPLEHIINTAEIRSVQLHGDNGWVVTALQGCGISLTKLINIYHKLYRCGDSVWEVERSPYHLVGVLAHLMGTLTDTPNAVLQHEKRALREQCLDHVAQYLTDLGSSAHPSSAIITSNLRATQTKLERST